jgi:mRNA-degrading endonuclease toxin of MazEF toxin-antitoxin module
VNRGEIWLGQIGNKQRPVVILTRSIVLDVRQLVTVAEVTTKIRGTNAEVTIDPEVVGLHQPSVINCDGIHTISQKSLTGPIGRLDPSTLKQLCAAVSWSLGC